MVKYRHWIWWGDSSKFDIIHADSAPSLADDGFDKRSEAIEFVIRILGNKRDEINEELRRARSMLRREKRIEAMQ